MPTIRSIVVSLLPAAMSLSLACSLSIQSGYAGAPVAKTADDVDPLLAGERAPHFTVQTVERQDYVFDPDALDGFRTFRFIDLLTCFRGLGENARGPQNHYKNCYKI